MARRVLWMLVFLACAGAPREDSPLRVSAGGRGVEARTQLESENEEALQKDLDGLNLDCGLSVSGEIDWRSIDDEVLARYSVAGHCRQAIVAARALCAARDARTYFKKNVRRFRCRFGASFGLRVDGGGLVFDVDTGQANLAERARALLDQQRLADGRSLGEAFWESKTEICADRARRHFVVLGPKESARYGGLSYGQGRVMRRVPTSHGLSPEWFFDPMNFRKTNRAEFRGYDLRYYSRLDVAPKQDRCTLHCGHREIPLQRLPEAERGTLLRGLRFVERPKPRQPHALARSKRGVYYYVDRGPDDTRARDFRLYIGKKGRLIRQKMKDIVSDSEGEVFSSRRGALRLVLGKRSAEWIKRGRKRKLLWIPIHRNLGLIYSELGVYLGQTMGVPCDDL